MAVTLDEIQRRYEVTMEISDQDERDKALLDLMDLLVVEFGVPLIEEIEWDRAHPEAIEMYRKLSMSRSV